MGCERWRKSGTVMGRGTARFPCYGYNVPLFIYEVHFEGLHRSEQLAGLAFYDRVL
ncbi:hypothetical protein EXIGLDRAFT_771934 [Exidia glandulosa HHB12029]|uniref:Uncharacterized protein n=1 Tax=Exidia glandulosa HHB12029 TaxID=1314781 RepID=A0A165FM83_EXIGL|nr:hypothetical protein EXIGLDRAFT_771934 [Exidia glandulosa HHB12029]